MFVRKLLKYSPFILFTVLNLASASARAGAVQDLHNAEGGTSGGGGDPLEARVSDIRVDLLNWLPSEGPEKLVFPARLDLQTYRTKMSEALAPHSLVVTFVTTQQENLTSDPMLKVYVDGQPKTCRNFDLESEESGKVLHHLLCNRERFSALNQSEQYRLIHHEFAGIAGVEQNVGASSDYEISNQLTDFLVPQTVLRLSVNRGSMGRSGKVENLFHTYKLISEDVSGLDRGCPDKITIKDGKSMDATIKSGSYFFEIRFRKLGTVSQQLIQPQATQVVWDSEVGTGGVCWGSFGHLNRLLKFNSSENEMSISYEAARFENEECGFPKIFFKNKHIESNFESFALNQDAGVLTYITTSQNPIDGQISNRVCRMSVAD